MAAESAVIMPGSQGFIFGCWAMIVASMLPSRQPRARTAARGGLGRTEHHADLLAQLVDENSSGVGRFQGSGHLPEGLAHQTRLKTDVRISHLALNFSAWSQRGHRVDDDERQGA